MATLLFINACVRGEDSRTFALAKRLLERICEENSADLTFNIEEVHLPTENMQPLNYERIKRRDALLAAGQTNDTMFDYANAIVNADMIVIAAPYWDMSFPSLLKIFFELASVVGITFSYDEEGFPTGHANARDMYYVTTSGGFIGDCNFGFEYADALCRLYGVENTYLVSAEGLDMEGADVGAILESACNGDILKF